VTCDAEALGRGRVVIGGGCEIVSCGVPAADTEVAILRLDGSAAAADEVGEIAVHGPAVAAGSWERPAETAEVFAWRSSDGRTWLRTGDLGFMRAGRLYVTGRSKDVIVLRGRNHYPWLGDLRDAEARALRLYEQGKRQQWDATMRLDWEAPVIRA